MATPTLAHFAADTAIEPLMAALRRDGAVIVDDVIAPDALAALNAELAPYIAATPNGRDSFTGNLTTRTGALVARSAQVRTLVMDRLIAAAADALLLPFCERWQLHLTQAIRIKSGQGAQVIHRDRWAWGTHLGHLEPQLNTIWAVTDFTRANGATQVVPGSLEWPDSRKPEPHEIGYAEMSAGSVLIYTGGVFHGGGANVSDGDRIGLNITYTLGWLRQEENQYLACPPDIARGLPPELQAVLGYAMGSYALGYYTPPLPPGAGPEVVPPEYSLGRSAADATLGDAALLAAISAEVAAN
ncbi:phytanoyl-CoA dioxygenase family protein [Polymorphobacter arshaanensis]|uniref:Phytanoyl-CoA dioxygenase family protein n=1 Tax=Glacieibacterium arshaanense TaxID=2511025 RepID=A0A4Y9EJT5_9SPHN|nr:phytanoyl-CoA dioxygenase family protein [Polymorphobacter arshaanensis]TFU01014.1 phytanoyl-CoA dioxygenase family protein [Polymorphobacter arshaanensis]